MPRPTQLVVVALWLAGIATGGAGLLGHQTRPGSPGTPPADWPPEAAGRPAPGHFTLLVFAHPLCPCTRATFGELAWVLARAPAPVDAAVVAVRPPGAPPGWGDRSALPAASAALGARLVADDGGREAAAFGAETSGTVLLYDPAGRLVFRGGVTPGRGHAGDGPARRALLAALRGDSAGPRFPVFGCPLTTPADPQRK